MGYSPWTRKESDMTERVASNPPANAGDLGSISGSEDPLEKAMATHSSILAWRIPWTEEAGGLQSMALKESTDLVTKQQIDLLTHWTTREVP